MIDEILSKIQNRITDLFGSIFTLSWIPEIYTWYFWLFLLFLLCGVIIWFFGWSKIVRIAASMTFLIAAVFVAGGYVMARRMNAKKAFEEARERQRQSQRARQQRAGQSNQPWKWPWDG